MISPGYDKQAISSPAALQGSGNPLTHALAATPRPSTRLAPAPEVLIAVTDSQSPERATHAEIGIGYQRLVSNCHEQVRPELLRLIDEIVSAVGEGDDRRVSLLLVERFAPEADVSAAFILRQRLQRDQVNRQATPQAASERLP